VSPELVSSLCKLFAFSNLKDWRHCKDTVLSVALHIWSRQWEGLQPLAYCSCGFESRREHGCLYFVHVVCCQVDVSAKRRVCHSGVKDEAALPRIGLFRQRENKSERCYGKSCRASFFFCLCSIQHCTKQGAEKELFGLYQKGLIDRKAHKQP
jgi:hypothetical protein